jgi:hypothetical protein
MSFISEDPIARRRRDREPPLPSTFHQHGLTAADDEVGGRFAVRGSPTVIGTEPTPASQYPAASAAHQTQLPDEPPLENPAGVLPASPSAEPGPTSADAPSSVSLATGDEQRADVGPSSKTERDHD